MFDFPQNRALNVYMNSRQAATWMTENNLSKRWLADRCGVSLKTVHNWFGTGRPLPLKAVLAIRSEMGKPDLHEDDSKKNSIVIDLSPEEFDKICRLAFKENKLPRMWAEEQLIELANLDISAIKTIFEEANRAPDSEES